MTRDNTVKPVPARTYVRKIQLSSFVTAIGIGIGLTLLWSRMIGYGFMSGAAISIVNFQLMAVDAFELIGKNPKKARSFIIGRYALRYVIMFGFLAVIATRTDFNIFATFIGLFLVQMRLFISHIVHLAMNR